MAFIVLGGFGIGLFGTACGLGNGDAPQPDRPVTTTPPPWRSWIVAPRSGLDELVVYERPGGAPLRLDTDENGTDSDVRLATTLASTAPLTLLARTLDVEADKTRWHEVLLPVRPNGSTGWVAEADVVVTHTDLKITIRLAARRLTLTSGADEVASLDVAVGTSENPTPTGEYFIKELLAPDDPTGTYGPLAYGLSGYSPTIRDSKEFADGVIGVHGTNQPELIGQAVSHGCIRLRNADIETLRSFDLPLGTPVEILA